MMDYIMKYAKIMLPAMCALALMLGSCRPNKEVRDSLSYYSFETSYVGTSPSGLVTVRAWGSGPDKAHAIEEAKKNAVSDVIFKGIKGAPAAHTSNPVVTEVNARERYAGYFDRFFADGGEYKYYVKETSLSDGSRTKAKSSGRENFGITVDVDRSALVQRLRADGVIN